MLSHPSLTWQVAVGSPCQSLNVTDADQECTRLVAHQRYSHRIQYSSMHPTLRHLLVCISFQWDIRRLVFLQATLYNMATYPTQTTVKILSDQPDYVRKVLAVWSEDKRRNTINFADKGLSFHVECEGPSTTLQHPAWLNWAHRDVFRRAAVGDLYSLYMHIEDDSEVSFQALESWVHDTAFLRSQNTTLQRGFFRTVFNVDGDLHHSDNVFSDTVNFSDYTAKVTLAGRLFAQLPNPYAAMWVADQALLDVFMQSRQWSPVSDSPWGVVEMGSGSIQFVHVPDGFSSAWVVPIDSRTRCPSASAAIRHASSKGPDTPESAWGKLPVCDIYRL